MTQQEKLDRRHERLLATRFRWAKEFLDRAGFVEWGESLAHGRSLYYIPNGSELKDESYVRIRVSDHDVHLRRERNIDFIVQANPLHTRTQIERMVREAVQDRKDYLASGDYKKLLKRINDVRI
jgi:hypothetical protein